MQDESVREIQLNGKQLVFLFMTATAAAVVIFLCGVMVGRGVNSPPALSGNSTTAPVDPTADVIYGTEPAGELSGGSPSELLAVFEEPPIQTDDVEPAEPAPVEPAESVPVPEPVPLPEPAAESQPVPSPVVEAPAQAATSPPTAQPKEYPTEGYVVQVAAVRARSQADSIAADLTAKGFRAFVSSPETGAPFFRVRIGRFENRSEADRVASRIETEERLTTWVTR